jgi:membrane associated rhomboid family serine protease
MKTQKISSKRSVNGATGRLMAMLAVLFILDRIFVVWFSNGFWERYLPLSMRGLGEGYVWQLGTYIFIHGSIWHLLGNLIVLSFSGRYIEKRQGAQRLYGVFWVSAIVGALSWLLLNFFHSQAALLVGASAGTLGLFSYFCMIYGDQPINVLLSLLIPVRLKPRKLLMLAVGLEVLGFLIQELPGGVVANSAHLGGLLGGYLCYLFQRYRRRCASVVRDGSEERPKTAKMVNDSYGLYITSYSAQKREIDRILDKINESGFHSLTEAERKTLNAAKHIMHR